MNLRLLGKVLLLFTGLFFCGAAVEALEFEPGVGAGVEYTDNARLTPDDTVDDVIAVGYVGARLTDDEGPLKFNASTAFNNQSYTQDTYPDQHYFNLAANADWEMIRDRFDWTVSDYYSQLPINTLDANTPNNLQDSNIFTFGANMVFPLSAQQNLTLTPLYSQYYYEYQLTDNKQFALTANWNYQMYPLTSIGLSLGSRKINYTENNSSSNTAADTTFTNAAFFASSQRVNSNYSINLGATNVNRDGGGDSTGFAGSINWLSELTSRSKLQALASTDLTDSGSVILNSVKDPISGNPNDVQITTDVIRNTVFGLVYMREDASLDSRIWANYRKVTYSDSPQDQVVREFGVNLNYPITQLLSSGAYTTYTHTKQLNTGRIDKRYKIGGNLRYQLSRKWRSLFDVQYRTKDSTDATQSYDEFSVFASLVYGFGDVYRPSSAGGF
jgi:hypothetical protein